MKPQHRQRVNRQPKPPKGMGVKLWVPKTPLPLATLLAKAVEDQWEFSVGSAVDRSRWVEQEILERYGVSVYCWRHMKTDMLSVTVHWSIEPFRIPYVEKPERLVEDVVWGVIRLVARGE